MDITREVLYRNFKLNDADLRSNIVPGRGIGSGISGCVLDSADISDVDVIQFLEKRSEADGMDAGDPTLGARRIRMSGTLYEVTRALLFDRLWELRAALSPKLALRDAPADHGYQPLYFSTPTNRTEDYPDGLIELRVLALPRAFQAVIQRNQIGGDDASALAIPWQATFVCKDPSIMAALPQDYDVARGPGATAIATGSFVNRGNYLCPLNGLWEVGTQAGTIVIATAGTINTITIPASTGNRIIRYKGIDKLVTFEENDVETPRLGALTFGTVETHPLIPEGTTGYTVTYTNIDSGAGSHLWFWETYA